LVASETEANGAGGTTVPEQFNANKQPEDRGPRALLHGNDTAARASKT
jgi:hypothetical protein